MSEQRDLSIAILILLAGATLAYSFYTPIWPPDLAALYFAARLAHEGQLAEIYAAKEQIFSGDMPASWAALAAALGHPTQVAYPYIYPPLWATLLAPVAGALSPFAFFKTVFIVQIAALAGAILATRQIMSGHTIPASLWALISVTAIGVTTIGFGALVQNQPQITVTCLVLFSLLCLKQKAPVAAGLLLALAAAIKLTPILFVLLLVVEREWRAVLATVGGLSAFTVASVLTVPGDIQAQFFTQLDNVQAILPMMPMNFSLQTFLGWLVAGEQMQVFARSQTVIIWVKPGWLDPAGLLLMVIGLGVTFWITRGQTRQDRFRIRPFAVFLLIYVSGPLGWSHYFLPLLLCLPGVLLLFTRAFGTALIAFFTLAWSYPLHLQLMSVDPLSGLSLSWNICLLIGFLAVLWSAAARRQKGNQTDH